MLLFNLSCSDPLPPDSKTGFCWAPWSSPGGPEGPAPTARSVSSCAGAVGHRTWRSVALPAGDPAHSPRSWQEPGEQREREELTPTPRQTLRNMKLVHGRQFWHHLQIEKPECKAEKRWKIGKAGWDNVQENRLWRHLKGVQQFCNLKTDKNWSMHPLGNSQSKFFYNCNVSTNWKNHPNYQSALTTTTTLTTS